MKGMDTSRMRQDTMTASSPVVPPYDPAQDIRVRHRGTLFTLMRQTGWILWQDLRTEMHGFATLVTMGAFSVLAVLLLGLMLDPLSVAGERLVPGVLWASWLLAGTLGLERLFATPQAREAMVFLLVAPIARSVIFGAKWLWGCLQMLCAALASVVAAVVLFDTPLVQVWFWISLLLGCMGYAAVGVTVAAMTATFQQGSGLVAVVVLPLTVPLFLAGTGMGQAVLQQEPWPEFQHWFYMMVLFDIIAIMAGLMVAEYLWRDWH